MATRARQFINIKRLYIRNNNNRIILFCYFSLHHDYRFVELKENSNDKIIERVLNEIEILWPPQKLGERSNYYKQLIILLSGESMRRTFYEAMIRTFFFFETGYPE